MAIRPWTVEGSRTLLKDRWINLRADECRLPDGTPVSPFYVNSLPDFVVAVALTTEGEFIFVRQYRHGTGQILLEFPAGCLEETDPDAGRAAARELLEETGYAGDPPVFLCKVAPNASGLSNFAHCYLITGCRKVREQELDATEDIEVVILSREETDRLLAGGGLVQAVHVAAMYYADRILKDIKAGNAASDG